uniref:Testis expressed 264, ER-phagy receptor n=1 Tax=Hucho hucho TaxID=62062 RepID=A0A4W5QUU9_9TELE
MSEWLILCLIFVLLSLVTIVGYVLYSGLLSEIHIRTGSPPIKNITIAYKFKQGPYKECGQLFTESCSIGPNLSSIGVFYDDPKKVIGEKCRCAVGSVLSEGDTRPSEELQQLYEKFGFRVFSFPEVTHVVSACFPHRTPLSIFFGVQRVYPQLDSYIKERKLCAHPCLEIYRDDLIHYMSPLARQGDFYVPEVRQDPDRRLLGDNDSEEDRGTDITGADSNSECSSGSGVFLSDSRETSLAPSRGGEDRSDRSSRSSSFEELDMELPDGQVEEAGTELAIDAPCNKHLETTTEERGVIAGGEE